MVAMKMVATDLDGTIIPHGGSISQRTLDAFAACEEAGIKVVYVTGRPPRWLDPVIEVTGHRGYAIAANGAMVIDVAREQHLTVHGIPTEVVEEVVHTLRKAIPDIALAVETPELFWIESAYQRRRDPRAAEGLRPVRDTETERYADRVEYLIDGSHPVIKIVGRSAELGVDELLAVGREHVNHLVAATHSSVDVPLLEMGAKGITKATTLAELAQSWDLTPADVITFGDMPNDVDMLRWSGHSYAMTGGHFEAIAAAQHVAPPASEDGVAQVLEQMLAER
ncbi:MAG TPA: HAD family hydrolase [Actinomycetales bacterium]|nr:HAD family hydrolase [Actinomycetales bacterium]